jgi:hypothetical protein
MTAAESWVIFSGGEKEKERDPPEELTAELRQHHRRFVQCKKAADRLTWQTMLFRR